MIKKITLLLVLICFQMIDLFAQSPIVHWKLNGNANNETGAFFGGTLHRNPILTTNRFGASNTAYRFTRVNNLIRFGDILDTLFCKSNSQFTITGWAKTASLPPFMGGNMIVTKSLGGNGPYQWHINHDQDGRVKAIVSFTTSASSYIEKSTAATVDTGQWFHYSLVFDGSATDSNKVKFYVNGVLTNTSRRAGTSFGTATSNSTQELTIGGSYAPALHADSVGNGYDGSIDDIRIYNQALSLSEVQQDITNSLRKISATGLTDISIYPNPSKGRINIEHIDYPNMSVLVYNILGQKVHETIVKENNAIIDLSNIISSGTYIIHCVNPNTQELYYKQKLIIE